MKNEAMISRVDDETVRLLMESILCLTDICEKNNLNIDLNDLPHCQKLKMHQIEQIRSLIKNS